MFSVDVDIQLIHDSLNECRELFRFCCICWYLLCVQVCGQFRRKFHWVLVRRYIILCLGGMFCKSFFKRSIRFIRCYLQFLSSFCLADVWEWDIQVSHHQCVRSICDICCRSVSFTKVDVLIFGAWMLRNVILVVLFLNEYEVSFLISFEVYFVRY